MSEEDKVRYIELKCLEIKQVVEEKDKEIEKLNNIINKVREILKFHLSNPSGTKNGWHIDIWNSEDISKLNDYLEILDKESE